MKKERIAKDDGRYLIYYTFDDEDDPFKNLPGPQPRERAKEEDKRNDVRTEMEPAA
jgi:hypothetical protein